MTQEHYDLIGTVNQVEYLGYGPRTLMFHKVDPKTNALHFIYKPDTHDSIAILPHKGFWRRLLHLPHKKYKYEVYRQVNFYVRFGYAQPSVVQRIEHVT